jgi:UDPglucose 6-dehydrogenase
MKKNIGVFGLWHLGCVLCASWSKLGNNVIGFDYNSSTIKHLNKGITPIYEPSLAETINAGLRNKTINFSNNINSLSSCDFIFLSYDTPILENDLSDTGILEKSVEDVRNVMKNESVLVVSSQSPVGLCARLRLKLKEKNSSVDLAYSPENLRLGNAIQCYLNPERIILGTSESRTKEKCSDLFSQIKSKIYAMNLESAELVKHGINSFLAMSIVFINHLADICEYSGARIEDVILGMKSDPRIGEKAYLSPGIGFSGGTLGRDLRVLEQKNLEKNGNAKIFGIVHELNNERKYSIIRRVQNILGNASGNIIGILGVTYKPGTSTLRRSLPLEIVELLLGKKNIIKVYDPKADYSELPSQSRFTIASTIEDASTSSDILILLTEWEEFKNYDWEKVPKLMKKAIFFDTKNFLNENKMTLYGFKYYSIGR